MKTKTCIKRKFAFLLIAASLVIFSTVHAQQQQTSEESALATKFGIKGGLNLTNLSSDNFTDNHLKPGFNVGIFFEDSRYAGILDPAGIIIQSEGFKNRL